jgi:hypothetical protein
VLPEPLFYHVEQLELLVVAVDLLRCILHQRIRTLRRFNVSWQAVALVVATRDLHALIKLVLL